MRYSLIDLFRVSAIFLIIIYHISSEIFPWLINDFINIGHVYRFNLGSLGVSIFILISGLCLGLKYAKQKIKYSEFIAKRFLRIYPSYLLALILGIIIYYCIPKNILENGYYYLSSVGLSDFVCSFLGFCYFIGRIGGPFLGPGWFIALIIILYLIFPLLIKKFRHDPHTSLFVLFLISLIFRYIEINIPSLYLKIFAFFPLRHLFEFGLGIYLSLRIKKNFWSILNKYQRFSYIITYLGILSFPLFLIHHPLIFILNYLNQLGSTYFFSIFIYLLVCLLFSFLLNKIIKKIPIKNL